ncbi:MAG TPA: hypothetical protein VMY42_25190, partial [Thermoguttaceae bacterium]|nr:hypothetical protein [Thermoguttaceae bacterium]
MKTSRFHRGCACCELNRRQFLAAGCAACAAATGFAASEQPARAAANNKKTRIQILYSLHAPKQPRPDWPNVGFDFQPVMDRITGTLAERFSDFEFVAAMANGPEEAGKILDADKSADG